MNIVYKKGWFQSEERPKSMSSNMGADTWELLWMSWKVMELLEMEAGDSSDREPMSKPVVVVVVGVLHQVVLVLAPLLVQLGVAAWNWSAMEMC